VQENSIVRLLLGKSFNVLSQNRPGVAAARQEGLRILLPFHKRSVKILVIALHL
jgi:hypothetical protein